MYSIFVGIAACLIADEFRKLINGTSKRDEVKQTIKSVLISLVTIIIFPLAIKIFSVDLNIAKKVFSGFGIRTENATIQVPKDILNQISELHNIDNMSLNDVTVLWHRIGDTSYIQFSDKNKFLRMEIDRSNLNVSKISAY